MHNLLSLCMYQCAYFQLFNRRLYTTQQVALLDANIEGTTSRPSFERPGEIESRYFITSQITTHCFNNNGGRIILLF